MKRYTLIVTVLAATVCTTATAQNHRLWYTKPASHWLEALPVGNSHLGAMIYGGTDTEEIQLNEETFWSGQPHNNNPKEALAHLPEVRRLIFEGHERDAAKLLDKYFVPGTHGMRFLPLGSLKLKLGHNDVLKYERALNLGNATATTSYIYKGVRYERTVFASQADSVIVVQLKAGKKGALSFTMNYQSQLPCGVKSAHTCQCGLTEGSDFMYTGLIGIDAATLKDTFLYCKEVRARYTVFQTVYDLGLLDELSDGVQLRLNRIEEKA